MIGRSQIAKKTFKKNEGREKMEYFSLIQIRKKQSTDRQITDSKKHLKKRGKQKTYFSLVQVREKTAFWTLSVRVFLAASLQGNRAKPLRFKFATWLKARSERFSQCW